MLYHRQPDGSLALVKFRRRHGVVLQRHRGQLLGAPDPADETAIFRALHQAAIAKYQATHGPTPNATAAAVAQQAMDSLGRAYLALGRSNDELAAALQISWWEKFLAPIGETARKASVGLAVVAGVGVLGYVMVTRPPRRMDY